MPPSTKVIVSGRLSRKFPLTLYYDFEDETGGIGEAVDEDWNGAFTVFQNNWQTEQWKKIGAAINGKTFEYPAATSEEIDGTVTLRFASTGKISAKCKFVTGKDPKTQKDIVYSATGSAILAGPMLDPAVEGGFRAKVYIYFPPKQGKFAGYMRDFELEWDGEKFERVD